MKQLSEHATTEEIINTINELIFVIEKLEESQTEAILNELTRQTTKKGIDIYE